MLHMPDTHKREGIKLAFLYIKNSISFWQTSSKKYFRLFLLFVLVFTFVQIIFITKNFRFYKNHDVSVMMVDTGLISYIPVLGLTNRIFEADRLFLVKVSYENWSYIIEEKEFSVFIDWSTIYPTDEGSSYALWCKSTIVGDKPYKIINIPKWDDELVPM